MTTASVRYTDDFVVDALRHYRLQHGARRSMVVLKVLLTLPLAALAIFGFIHEHIGLGLFFVGLCILLLFGHHIDLWLARRSLRKWAFRDEAVTIEFTDEAFHARSPKQETMLRWSSFTKAVHFRDGFLLFHGPASFHWIPATAFAGPSDVSVLERLLRNKIAVHKIVEPCAAPNHSLATQVGSSGVT